MKIAISVESTNDLPKEIIQNYDIKVIPYQIVLGDETFKDGEKTNQEMFEFVDKYKKLPKTNALNEFEYTEYFESLLKDYDAVVHICLSSGLTSSCDNAFRAAKNLSNVYTVDSLNLSTGIGLLAMYAKELANKGEKPETIVQKLNDRVSSVQATFIVERLDYLYKGGRCNSLQLLGANLFHIRPRIVVKNGKMSSDKKYRGQMERVVAKYAQELFTEFNTPDLTRVFVTYSSATHEMINEAIKACAERGFKQIIQATAGGTVASHCGPNTLGIIYFNDGE